MVITSRQNPLVKDILALKEKKGRRAQGLYIAEGLKPVREALASGAAVKKIIYSQEFSGAEELLRTQPISGAEAVAVSAGVFEKLSEEASPQGVLALVSIPDCTPVQPQGSCLLLDGVSDPGNLGTIIRTANAAGYCDIYLRNCADPFAPKCVRATMSGIFFVRLHIGEGVLQALGDTPLVCADMGGENVFSFSPPQKFCLVIGSEANGVSAEVRALCKYTVKIPMQHTCESLNAGVSAGILMYELQKKAGRVRV